MKTAGAFDRGEPTAKQIANKIRKLRKGTSVGKTSIRQLIDEGRRY